MGWKKKRLFFLERFVPLFFVIDGCVVGLASQMSWGPSVSSAQKSFEPLPSVQAHCRDVPGDPVSHADVIPVRPTADIEDLPVAIHYAGRASATCSPNLSCQMLFSFVMFTELHAPAVL